MKTPLFENQLLKGAKFIPFAGFDLPLSYTSIMSEYEAVRSHVALFDISHMGMIRVKGEQTLPFLDHLSAHKVLGAPMGKALYTLFCTPEGGVIDDLLLYLIEKEEALLIVNGINRQQVLNHLQAHSSGHLVTIQPQFDSHGILSLQGPLSKDLLKSIYPEIEKLKKMEFFLEQNSLIARTGYTGELGYELFLKNSDLIPVWNKLIEQGAPFSLQLAGLGARDLLRQEMGYALYGHELSKTISPLESVAAWCVNLDHDFIGKEAVLKKKPIRFAKGLVGKEAPPAREGYKVFYKENEIGTVTSGTFSPFLKKPIALSILQIDLPEESEVEIEIRNKLYPFTITKIPFYRRNA